MICDDQWDKLLLLLVEHWNADVNQLCRTLNCVCVRVLYVKDFKASWLPELRRLMRLLCVCRRREMSPRAHPHPPSPHTSRTR